MKCPKCKKGFYETEMFRKHIRIFHGIKDGEVLVCTEDNCSQTFSKVFNFIRHCKKYYIIINNIHKQSEMIFTDHLPDNNLKLETVDFSTCTI